MGLFRGSALLEFADEPWAETMAMRLDALRLVATEDLAETMVEMGNASAAIAVLEPHVRAHPHRERPGSLLMRALADERRPHEALSRFTSFVGGLDSNRASRGVAELHGVAARASHDWPDAVHWYGQIDADKEGEPRTWFDLIVAWPVLEIAGLGTGPGDPDEDLDRLLGELFDIANELDGGTEMPA